MEHRGPLGYSPLAAFYSDTRFGAHLAHAAAKMDAPYATSFASTSSVYSSVSRSVSRVTRSSSTARSRSRAGPSLPTAPNPNTNTHGRGHQPTNSITSTISALSAASAASAYWPGSELLHMLRAAEERADMEVYAAYRPDADVDAGTAASRSAPGSTPASSHSHPYPYSSSSASHASHTTLHVHAGVVRGHYDPYARRFRATYFDPVAYYGLEDGERGW